MKKISFPHLIENLDDIQDILISGGIMIYPTETLAGIGCIGNNKKSVEKLFKIKQREANKPVSYAFSSIDMIRQYAIIPKVAEPLVKLLPAPLTLVLALKENAPKLYGLDGKTIGVRLPKIEWLITLISKLGTPIITTSANISGNLAPNKFDDLDPQIISEVDLVIKWNGILGDKGSTVISFVDDMKILREGAISTQDILNLVNS